ncbi:MAG: D-2-hydroxyacid dehydrogenase [Clostridiales bacterium]|nr:D-2-hydroxyacid dehydrogenase [Clostridiales bacterium]
MKIVILDGSAANPGDISWGSLEKLGEVTAYDITSKDQLLDRMKGAECAITNKTVFDRAAFEQLPDLKYIGVLATGYNVIDLEAAREHGVTVTNVPEYATFATAQHTMALLLELTNLAGLHSGSVMDGEWCRSPQFCYFKAPLTELCGKTLHIIGLGKIGRRVAQMATAFGMNVTATPHDTSLIGSVTEAGTAEVKCVTFEEGVRNADVISLHCPLTEDTREIINRDSLSLFKPGAMLINCARGPVINESAVREALDSGLLGGYGADVVCVEPMIPENPLLGAPNCVITPHIAWTPVETRLRLIDMAASNLKAFMDGSPVNTVT